MFWIVVLGVCCGTPLISEQWFRYGAIGQQAINWLSVDRDLSHHMASQDHNELKIQVDIIILRPRQNGTYFGDNVFKCI